MLKLAVVLAAVTALFAPPFDLRVTDSRGTHVVVMQASINYGGMFSVDRQTDGIRVQQGDGIATLKWADVDSLNVTRVDSTAKPARIELSVRLRNGKRVAAELFRKGDMKLTGRTDLGEYEIDLEKIRTIVPVR
jgi:hypothetical protein